MFLAFWDNSGIRTQPHGLKSSETNYKKSCPTQRYNGSVVPQLLWLVQWLENCDKRLGSKRRRGYPNACRSKAARTLYSEYNIPYVVLLLLLF